MIAFWGGKFKPLKSPIFVFENLCFLRDLRGKPFELVGHSPRLGEVTKWPPLFTPQRRRKPLQWRGFRVKSSYRFRSEFLSEETENLLRILVGNLENRDRRLAQNLTLRQLGRFGCEVRIDDFATCRGNVFQSDTK